MGADKLQHVAKQLWYAPPCCKDAYFTLRLQSTLFTWEDLTGHDVRGMLKDTMANLDTHVANLERDHATSRMIYTRFRGSPLSIEDNAFKVVLRRYKQVWLRTAGRHAGMSRVKLRRLGVKTHSTKAKSSGPRAGVGGNGAFAYINHRLSEDGSLSRKTLAKDYRALPADQRGFWVAVARQRCGQGRRGHSRTAATDTHTHLGDHPDHTGDGATAADDDWDFGDQEWPLAQSRLETYVRTLQATATAKGMQAMGEHERAHWCKNLLIPEPAGGRMKPPTELVKVCYQKHPGLCCSRHSLIRDQAMSLADALHRVVLRAAGEFTANNRVCVLQGRAAHHDGPDDAAPVKLETFLYLAAIRKVPALVAFAVMKQVDVNDEYATLQFESENGCFNIQTSYSMVAAALTEVQGDDGLGGDTVFSFQSLKVWGPGSVTVCVLGPMGWQVLQVCAWIAAHSHKLSETVTPRDSCDISL